MGLWAGWQGGGVLGPRCGACAGVLCHPCRSQCAMHPVLVQVGFPVMHLTRKAQPGVEARTFVHCAEGLVGQRRDHRPGRIRGKGRAVDMVGADQIGRAARNGIPTTSIGNIFPLIAPFPPLQYLSRNRVKTETRLRFLRYRLKNIEPLAQWHFSEMRQSSLASGAFRPWELLPRYPVFSWH